MLQARYLFLQGVAAEHDGRLYDGQSIAIALLWPLYVIGQAIIFFALWFLLSSVFLWSPYVIGQTIIFLPCDFYLSSSFFSSPNLSGRRLDVYHTSTHGVALVQI